MTNANAIPLNYIRIVDDSPVGGTLAAMALHNRAMALTRQLNDIEASSHDAIGYGYDALLDTWNEIFYGRLLPLLGSTYDQYDNDPTEGLPDFVLDHVTPFE